MTPHLHTPEQTAILTTVATTDGNIMVESLAGCGKTSTLEAIETLMPSRPILYLAFNKAIAKDAEKRMSSTTQVRTFNGLGHRIWGELCSKRVSLDGRKNWDILREFIKALPRHAQGPYWDDYAPLADAIARAKTLGYIPFRHDYAHKSLITFDELIAGLDDAPSEDTTDAIDACLLESIRRAYAGSIDFADQIYMPTLFGGSFPQFPLTLVDEYQDLNPLNHLMIKKLTRTGRLIGVGDPYQNIYGFRGAVADGMPAAVSAHAMTRLPLSHSFRCPEAIVRGVWWHVPHFRWTTPGGASIVRLSHNLLDFEEGSAIICRNNAPLFALAMRLLAAGRSVSLAGSDIGPKLVRLLRKLGGDDLTQPQLLSAIDGWEVEHAESASSADTAECMRVFARLGDNLVQAIAYAEHVLAQKGTLSLMTGHKSKGLEFPVVYHLDPWLIGDTDQENNLRYVISTRSSNLYVEICSSRIDG